MKKGCCYGDDDKMPMSKSKKGGIPDKQATPKKSKSPIPDRQGKGGKGIAHEVHHHNRPHGLKGPRAPEGY